MSPPAIFPEQDAETWFTRMNSGAQPSAEDAAAFKDWLRANPTHAEQYRACQMAWLELGVAAGAPDMLRLRAQALGQAGGVRRRDLLGGAAIAAAAAAALAIGLGHDKTAVTRRGERLTSTLADGSELTLAPLSRARLAFSDAARIVVLERGQGYFNVAHDAARPFQVIAGAYVVTAIGTRFQVALRGAEIDVVLEEGVVSVARRDGAATPRVLAPAQRLAGDAADAAVEPVDLEIAAAWRSGRLIFRDQALADVAEQFNLYSRDRLIIGDARAGALRISGAFDYADARGFALALAQSFPLSAARVSDNTWRVSSQE